MPFIIIKNYPHFANALILKAETIKKQIKAETDNEKANKMFADLENQYKFIHKIGYRNMPEEMYLNWLVSLKTERNKFENSALKR